VRSWFTIVPILTLLALVSPVSAGAAPCDRLALLPFAHARVTSANIVSAGTFVLPPASPRSSSDFFTAFEKLTAFCRVQGVIAPARDSHIEFEVWLPVSDWNGKYIGAGNGGLGGTINYYRIAEAVNAGYVGSSTDIGHRISTIGEDHWDDDRAKRIDFDHRAIHETAVLSKALAMAFYETPVLRSYFISCSNGGRQALVEAQRYPSDYDGIIAGAPSFTPALNLNHNAKDFVNLTAFKSRGGKLILYHGERDLPSETVTYYQKVVSKMGRTSADEFIRLFIVPEMGHCGGGPVPDFGLRLWPVQSDPQRSLSVALERWVERGVPPDTMIATKHLIDGDATSDVIRTRPLCAYPLLPWWTTGDVDEATSYSCRLPR